MMVQERFAENNDIPKQLAAGALQDDIPPTKVVYPAGKRPDIDSSEHDESLASPARNPVFAIKTIIINKHENSGEITDETASRTTRTEEEDEEISDTDRSLEHHHHGKNGKHTTHNNNHNKHSPRKNGTSSRSEKYIQAVTNIVSNVPNGEDNDDNLSTQSPFSVPTVDLFPVDSQHSILTSDDCFNTSHHTVSKRSTNSLALSPSVSQRGSVSGPVTVTAKETQDPSARRRPAKTPTLRPLERTNSFIQRRNKRLEQIKKRVMSKKQQRMQEQQHQHLEGVQEEEEKDFYDDEEDDVPKTPSSRQRPKVATISTSKEKSSVTTSPTATTTSSSPVTSSSGSSSTPRRCYSADRGRKESRGVTVRDNSPLSTKSETRQSSRKIRVEHRRSSRRSRSREEYRRNSKSPVKQKSAEFPSVPQSPGSQIHQSPGSQVPQSPNSQSSSQYRSHRQEQAHYDHLEEELTMANSIISQQQEQIKSLQDTNKDWQSRFDHAQQHHEEQLEKALQSLYQAQKKQEKTEQDLNLALNKINSLNELHEAVAKIQQLTGLQLLGNAGGDDVSIKSDGTKSVKSAPHLANSSKRNSMTKKDLLSPLAETSYISDASDSDTSEIHRELGQMLDAEAAEQQHSGAFPTANDNDPPPMRRFSGSHIPDKTTSNAVRTKKSKQQPKSPPTSFAPVVPSRQDQSQASFLDSALNRKAATRRYSSHH